MLFQFFPQPLFVVFIPAITLGILHTFIPCEDKAIFFFWSFGISKTIKGSVFILVLYGLGLTCSNLLIATGTIVISFIPQFLGFIPDEFSINFFGAVTSMFAGFFLLIFIIRKGYMPHSKQKDEIVHLNWEKKKTPYLFGILAGFAPCIFELLIYTWCLQWSLRGGFGFIDGIFTVLYFSLGTFIGLFPLALVKHGTSQIRKTKQKERRGVLISMILIIVIFNATVMILSFLKIPVFPTAPF